MPVNTSPRRIIRVLAALLLLGLTGCSPTGPVTPGSSEAPSPGASPTASAIESVEETFTMPLDPYRAMVSGMATFDAEKIAADANREGELRAQCMSEQGFEYFLSPTTAEEILEFLERTREPSRSVWDDRGTVAFAEKYGFGLVHAPENEEEQSVPDEQSDPIADPETEYLNSLSESERDAWQEALWGDPDLMVPRGEDGPPDPDEWKMQGCAGRARHEVSGGKLDPDEDPAFTELVTAVQDATPIPDNDEDMAALESEWSQCMAAEGFSFTVRQDAAIIVENELDDLWPRGADGKPDQAREPTAEQTERFFADREFPVAMADATCAEQMDYTKRRHDITVAFETCFIDEHRKQLDALALRYGPEAEG